MHLSSHCQSVPFDRFHLIQYFLSTTIKHIGWRQIIQRLMVSMLWAWVPFDDLARMHNELIKKYPHRKPYKRDID
jgi:hypothetical protein